MKRVAAVLMLFTLPVWADITAKPDGTVKCEGTPQQPCFGKIGPGGENLICQGKICMEIIRLPPDGDTSDK